MRSYDFIVIGGGSAGFNAARVAADLGLKVAVLDGARRLGGLCILKGCMPSKTLLYSAEVLHRARTASRLGLRIPSARPDMPALHRRKLRLIADFASHRASALKRGKFHLYRAWGRFLNPEVLELSDGRLLRGRHILIATGSQVAWPDIPGLAESRPWTSDEVLELDFVPKSVIVLGGGLVACELAQFLNRIGSRVVVIQRSRRLLRDNSAEAGEVLRKAFIDEGIEVLSGTAIVGLRRESGGFVVRFRHGNRVLTRRAVHCLNALGRIADLSRLDLAAAGVAVRENGQIRVNRWQQTSVPRIYAAGDCAGPVEIVHIAIQQGELAARHAAGVKPLPAVDYGLLLNVVFTDPAVTSIGRLERELKEAGVRHLTASHPFDDHGKSILMEAKHGFVKVMAEPKRGRILGVEIVGPDAGELIHCFSGPMAMGATVFDLLRAPWYHPTLAEIVTYPLEEIAARIRN